MNYEKLLLIIVFFLGLVLLPALITKAMSNTIDIQLTITTQQLENLRYGQD